MASRTLYDPTSTTRAHSNEELVHPKPCVMVRLLDHNSASHRQACEAARERAWATAVHMLNSVLARAAAYTDAVIEATPPFEQSSAMLQPLMHLLLLSSSSTAASMSSSMTSSAPCRPPLVFRNRGYSADATCRSVRSLVELESAASIFVELERCLRDYVMRTVHAVSAACEADLSGDVTFLRITHAWGQYRLAIAEIRDVWVFLDRWYLHKTPAVKSIESLAILVFRDVLMTHPWLLQRAQAGYCTFMRRDFASEGEDTRGELRLFTDLCIGIQVYFLRVEPELLPLASQFYKEEADRMWNAGVAAEVFFEQVERYLQQGRQRVHACLDHSSLAKLEEVAQTALLLEHGVAFLERDFARMLSEGRYDSFRLAWKLLTSGKYVHLAKQCGAVFRQYISQEGAAIIRQLARKSFTTPTSSGSGPFSAVKAMIALMYRGENVIQKSFPEDSMLFSVQLRDALGEALQEHQAEFAEQLARYLDWWIREGEIDTSAGGSHSVGSNVLLPDTCASDGVDGGAVLKDIGRIYSLFPSKDVFEALYWRDLARRLLHCRRTSHMEVEESFIQSLKETCGAETSKYEGMLSDIKASHELNDRFQVWAVSKREGASEACFKQIHLGNEDEEGQDGKKLYGDDTGTETVVDVLGAVEVWPHILTDSFWPKQVPLEIHLPRPLRTLAMCLEEFYRSCFADRRLLWQHQMSSAVVKCTLGAVQRQLTGTLLQAAMLLTLQDMLVSAQALPGVVRVGALCSQLAVDISMPDVAGSILGLCHPKFRLLLRHPATANEDNTNNNTNASSSSNQNDTKGNSGVATGAAGFATTPLFAGDCLQLNQRFAVSTTRCQIPFYGVRRRNGGGGDVAGDKTDGDKMQTADGVVMERSHVVEAAIVRFMKEKRRVDHEELFTVVSTLVRFPVTTTLVKKAIERLIERGFLERKGTTAYIYLA